MGRAEGIFQGKETELRPVRGGGGGGGGGGGVDVDEIHKVSGREDFALIFSQEFYW